MAALVLHMKPVGGVEREGGQVGSNARNSCSAGGRIGGNSHDDFLIYFSQVIEIPKKTLVV